MKTFTKTVFASFLALILTANLSAQDIGATIFFPEDGADIRIGVNEALGLALHNYGSVDITSSDTIFIGYSINSSVVQMDTVAFGSNFAPGDSTPVVYRLETDNMSTGAIEICAWARVSNDANSANDTDCMNYTVVNYSRDVGISAITSPVPGEKVPIDVNSSNPTQLDIQFTLNNYSSSSISAGTSIPVQLSINGSSLDAQVGLQNELAANSDVSVTFSLTIPDPSQYAPAGITDICIATSWDSNVDPDATNDQTCASYTGVGIEEDARITGVNLYPNPVDDRATLRYHLEEPGHIRISIMNVEGRVVNEIVNTAQKAGDHMIEIDSKELKSGVYFYRIRTDRGINTGKLIVR